MLKWLKRGLFWLLLIVFVSACVIWFFTVPYRPESLYRFMPANTVYMSYHRDLASRWDEVVENPLAQTLMASAGLDTEEVLAWSEDDEVRPWLDKLLAKDFIVLHVPELGPTREPAWVLAGWIGGESIRLRWLMKRGAFPDLLPERQSGGGLYWRVAAEEGAQVHLSLAVVEGILVGAFSSNPHAVRHVLEHYDGLVPSYVRIHGEPVPPNFELETEEGEMLDWGWMRSASAQELPAQHYFGLTQLDRAGLAGTVGVLWRGSLPTMPTSVIETPSRLFGGHPFILLGAHPEMVYALLPRYLPPLGQQIFQGLYETGMDGMLMATVMGDTFAGTYLNFWAVPALTLAWPVPDEAEAVARVQRLLDDLNAEYRWGLVAGERRVGDRTVYAIESTASTPYALLSSRERVAFGVVDGWFVLSTHYRPLSRLIDRFGRLEALYEADDGGWQNGMRQGPISAYGFWDIAGGARTLRMAMNSARFILGHDSPDTRRRLDDVDQWVRLLEQMDVLEVRADRGGDWLRMHLKLSTKEEP
jgi:hypothetical protein